MAGKFTLKGVPDFEKNVKRVATVFPGSARRGLYLGLEFVMTSSKMTYVPVDQGVLRASGFVEMDPDPKRVRGTIGFGGPAGTGNMGGETNSEDVNYAIVQHENVDFVHRVGEAKFLERPLFAGIPQIGDTIVSTIKTDVGL